MASQDMREISAATVWQLSRPASLGVTVVACMLGLASAAGCGISPDWAGALASLLLAVAVHAAANILQTYHAARQGAHEPMPEGSFSTAAGVRLIQQGVITLAETRQLAWALLGLVMVAGVALALKVGGGLLLIGLAGWLLAWAYAAPPLRLSQRGGAEVSAAIAWWLVVLGADYVQRRHFFLISAVDAASFALLVAAMPLAQRIAPGRIAVTGVTRQSLNQKLTVALYLVLLLLAYGWLAGGVALLYQPQQALWGLLSLPVSLAAAGMLWRSASQPQRALLPRQLTVAAALLHGLAMTAGLMTVTMF
jgi:1,4-dihydroxy-2-naphthoate octaprenyltransferase